MEFTKYFDFLILLIIIWIWIGIMIFLRLKIKKDFAYLFFFSVFYIYVVKVLDFTLFQFQSLLLLRYFMPHLILHGQTAGKDLNLIPLITLTFQDIQTSLLNVLLFIPFGFLLPLIADLRVRKIVIIGMVFSILIELLQFETGHLAKITFRIADINDVIFNTIGVAVGYILFVIFLRFSRHNTHKWKTSTNPILRYIAERPAR